MILHVSNDPGAILRPGLYAKVRTVGDTLPDAVLIPPDAVLETQGQYQVAVVDADNKVSIRSVKLGKLAQGLRIIESGLSPGERVITEGLQKVSDGMTLAPTVAAQRPSPANIPGSAGDASPSSATVPPAQS